MFAYFCLVSCISYYLKIDSMSGIKQKKQNITGPVKRIKKSFLSFEDLKAKNTQSSFTSGEIYLEIEKEQKYNLLYGETPKEISNLELLSLWLYDIVPKQASFQDELVLTSKDYYEKSQIEMFEKAINGLKYRGMIIPESLGLSISLATAYPEEEFNIINFRGSKVMLTTATVERPKAKENANSKEENEKVTNVVEKTKITLKRKELYIPSDFEIENFILGEIKQVVTQSVKDEFKSTVAFDCGEEGDYFCSLTEFKNNVIANLETAPEYTHPFVMLMQGNVKANLINALKIDLKVLRDKITKKFTKSIKLEDKKLFIYSRFGNLLCNLCGIKGNILDGDSILQGCCDVSAFEINDELYKEVKFNGISKEIFEVTAHVDILRNAENLKNLVLLKKYKLEHVEQDDPKYMEFINYFDQNKDLIGLKLTQSIKATRLNKDLQELNMANKADISLKESGIIQLQEAIKNAEAEGMADLTSFKEFLEKIKNVKGGGNEIQNKVYDLNFKVNFMKLKKRKEEEEKKRIEEEKAKEEAMKENKETEKVNDEEKEKERKEDVEIKNKNITKNSDKTNNGEDNIKEIINENNKTNNQESNIKEGKEESKKNFGSLMKKFGDILKKGKRFDKMKDKLHELGLDGSNPLVDGNVDDETFMKAYEAAKKEEEEKEEKKAKEQAAL